MPSPDIVLDFGRRAERLGFETAWVFDHLVFPHRILDSVTILGALGAVTSSIRLGIGVLMLPVRNPLIVAKEIASLDYMTKGRIELGVAIGGELGVEDFGVWKMAAKERLERLEEYVRAMNELWTRSPASYNGRYVNFGGAVMEPKPVQKPRPPIWVGGFSKAALRIAAGLADGYMGSYNHTPQYCKEQLESIETFARDNSRSLKDFRFGVQLFTHVAQTTERARKECEDFLTRYYRTSFDEIIRSRGAVVGNASKCVSRIKDYLEAGVTDIIIITTTVDPIQLESYANEILPSFIHK